jgi:hypothetical protein
VIAAFRRYRVFTPLALLLLVGALAGFALQERESERRSGPSLSSRDDRPQGSLALAMWLEKLGYDVHRLEWTEAVPESDVDILFVLRPTRRIRPSESEDIVRWINEGGTLIYHPNVLPVSTSSPSPSDGLSDRLDLNVRRVAAVDRATVGLQPLNRPEITEVDAAATFDLELEGETWMPLLVNGQRNLAATREMGKGRVYAFTTPALFNNESLSRGGNADVLLSLLARHSNARRVAFDEYHHGLVRDLDLMTSVRSTPWGWAALYAAAATLLFLIWGGRRFGPAIVPEASMGRSTGDYVSALAGLIQRARSVGWAQRELARLSRMEISRLLGVRADIPVRDLAGVLEGRRKDVSTDLAGRIGDLEGSTMSERALLDRARDIERDLRALRGVEGPR